MCSSESLELAVFYNNMRTNIMSDVICRCRKATKEDVDKAISRGAKTIYDVGIRSRAGTGCGSCRHMIEKMLIAQKNSGK